jgi:diadenosine tetraphosphate (Ap4A) HIT family hydrolase
LFCYNVKMTSECIFCKPRDIKRHTLIAESDLAYARWDNFPVSVGHAEVIPKRHVSSYFDLSEDEISALFKLSKETKKIIDEKYKPDSYNLGVNNGPEAGQTIPHCHIHLIPRYSGDVQNPRGGIRTVIPGKADY